MSSIDPDVEAPFYSTVWADAEPMCSAYGGTLASPEQMQQAFENGIDRCGWAWVNDQSAR